MRPEPGWPSLPRVTAHNDEYNKSLFSESGYYNTADAQSTTVIPDSRQDPLADEPARWHGGLDFGLLVIRLALGGTLGAHGLQKVFGLFGGPGVSEFARILGTHGFTSQTTTLSWAAGLVEVAGGRAWSEAQTEVLLGRALARLGSADPAQPAAAELAGLARMTTHRDH